MRSELLLILALRVTIAVVLLASLALAQETPSAAAHENTSPTTDSSSKNSSTSGSNATPGSEAAEHATPIRLEPDASGNVPPEQIRALLMRAEEKDLENDKQLRNYTYIERQEERKLDGHGNVEKTVIRTSEILEIYGEEVEKLTAKDDKLLSDAEAKKEDEKIQKIIDKRKNESESERRKRMEKEEKEREEDRKFVLEVADAFDFRLLGSEAIDGHDTWVLEGKPHPGYEPKRREAKILSKCAGRVWIDKAETQWVKLDVTVLDTISFGLVLARIHKGAHVVVDLTKVNEEVWLPKRVQLRLDAKVALVKEFREDIDQTFRDYKKFRTDTRMTVLGETQ